MDANTYRHSSKDFSVASSQVCQEGPLRRDDSHSGSRVTLCPACIPQEQAPTKSSGMATTHTGLFREGQEWAGVKCRWVWGPSLERQLGLSVAVFIQRLPNVSKLSASVCKQLRTFRRVRLGLGQVRGEGRGACLLAISWISLRKALLSPK